MSQKPSGGEKRGYQDAPPSFEAATGSSQVPPQVAQPIVPFRSRFASMSLHSWDQLRLLGFPFEITGLVRNVLVTSWPEGIQGERPYHGGSYELKLKGYPWTSTSHSSVTSRRLMMRILANLYSTGWVLVLSSDVSKSVSDCDTLVFRHQIPSPMPCQWMSISFSRNDRLRLIDAPGDLTEGVAARLASMGALQSRKPYEVPGCHELKLVGYPWQAWSGGAESMVARGIVLALVSILEDYGWTVYASVDQKYQTSSDSGAGGDSDTWHCCRLVSWVPGQPVMHR